MSSLPGSFPCIQTISKTTKSDAGWTRNCDWAVFANPTLTHQQKIRKYADGALFDPAQRCLVFFLAASLIDIRFPQWYGIQFVSPINEVTLT